MKYQLGYGHFLKWIEAEFGMAERSARNFMQVAEHFGKLAIVADLPPSILYALVAPSTPDEIRIEAIERVERGEKVSVADIRALRDKLGQQQSTQDNHFSSS